MAKSSHTYVQVNIDYQLSCTWNYVAGHGPRVEVEVDHRTELYLNAIS